MKEKEEYLALFNLLVFFPKILHFLNRSRPEGSVVAQNHVKPQIFVELEIHRKYIKFCQNKLNVSVSEKFIKLLIFCVISHLS